MTPPLPVLIDIDQATDSNHETALTIACGGGHDELVQLLLARKANIEHRDKKGERNYGLTHFVCFTRYMNFYGVLLTLHRPHPILG